MADVDSPQLDTSQLPVKPAPEDIQVHLPDRKTILHFPAGTKQEQIENYIKNTWKPPASPVDTSQIPTSTPTMDMLRKLGSTASEFARPMGTIEPALALGAETTAATAPFLGPGAPVAGALAAGGSYLGLDSLYQMLRNKIQTDSYGKPNMGESAINAAIYGVGSKAANAAKALADYGSGQLLDKGAAAFAELKPTLGQAMRKFDSPFANTVSWLEDTFAKGTKGKMQEASAKTATDALQQDIQNFAGTQGTENLAAAMRGEVQKAYTSTFTQADKQANIPRALATGETVNLGGQVTPEFVNALKQSGVNWQNLPANTQALIEKQLQSQGMVTRTPDRFVQGPVYTPTAFNEAQNLINKYSPQNSPMGISDSGKAFVNKLYEIVRGANPQYAKDGTLISLDPVNFDHAWEVKKDLDALGGWNKAIPDQFNREARMVTDLFNDDISNSLSKWRTDPNQLARQGWENAKATVHQRNMLFNPDNSSLSLADFISKNDTNLPAVDAIMRDKNKLEQYFNTGHIQFPSGDTYDTNAKQVAQAYYLQQLVNKGRITDPINNRFTIDSGKVKDIWSNPDETETRNTLFNQQQRADYDQLFKNLAATQEKLGGDRWGKRLWLVRGGIALAGGLIHGDLPSAVLPITSFEIGAQGLAKVMANPTLARKYIALAAGQPLQMSDEAFGRKVASVLQGTVMSLVDSNGKRTQVKVGPNGQFEPIDERRDTVVGAAP